MIVNNFSYVCSCNVKGATCLNKDNAAVVFTSTPSSSCIGSDTFSYYKATTGSSWYLDVGFGNTSEAATDYKLADSNLFDNSGLLDFDSGHMVGELPYIKKVVQTMVNNTNDTITVTEVALMVRVGASVANNVLHCMVARKVLDTPVSIPAGSYATFSYGIKL